MPAVAGYFAWGCFRYFGNDGGDGAREGGRLPGLRVTRAALYAELHGRKICKRPGKARPISPEGWKSDRCL